MTIIAVFFFFLFLVDFGYLRLGSGARHLWGGSFVFASFGFAACVIHGEFSLGRNLEISGAAAGGFVTGLFAVAASAAWAAHEVARRVGRRFSNHLD
jgi:hypothetical protein